MLFFKYFTPVSYWILTALWLSIFIFYLWRIRQKALSSRLFTILLTILAIDAFRTLFESIYFGFWYTSLAGFLPKTIHDFLVQPEYVFVPKIINVIAATLVIIIVIKRWIPEETEEREKEKVHTRVLEKEISERKRIQEKLGRSESQLLEAQELARIGHYVFDIGAGIWNSSAVLDQIFGIEREFNRSVEGWLSLVHPDDREMIGDYLSNHVLKENMPFDREYRIINVKSGESIWVHGRGHLKLDKNGELYEMFGTIQDISKHKKLVSDLEEALKSIKVLGGLIPICSRCHDIRDDKGYWNQLETYVHEHSDASFSHSLCPRCAKELYGDEEWFKKIMEDSE